MTYSQRGTVITDAAVIDAIDAYKERYGYAPTIREIASVVDPAATGDSRHMKTFHRVQRMISLGLLDGDAGKSRTLRVIR